MSNEQIAIRVTLQFVLVGLLKYKLCYRGSF